MWTVISINARLLRHAEKQLYYVIEFTQYPQYPSPQTTQRTLATMESVDNIIDLETHQTLAPQPKPALSLLPTELWTDIIDHLDIDSLYSVRQTCVALSTLVRPQLIEELALNPPLGDLYTLTKKQNPDLPFYERVFRMHHYLDDLLKDLVEAEPKRWADEAYEWDAFDPTLPAWTNHEQFRKETGRKGRGAKTRMWTDWNRRLFETRCLLRRQLARLWAADGRFFPFTRAENKEWKRRREERGCIVHPVIPKKLPATRVATSILQARGAEVDQHESLYDDNDDLEYYPDDFSPPPGHFLITSVPAATQPRSTRRSAIPASTDSRLTRLTDTYPTVTPAYYFRSTTKTPNQGFPTALADVVKRFSVDPGAKVLVFPASLTSYQRKELHRVTWFLKAGLKSVSMGEGSGRCLVVVKEDVVVDDN